MKYLILSLLFVLPVHAVSIGQYISSPEGSSIQTYSLSKGKGKLDKKSNFFDKKVDYSLGEFVSQSDLSKEEKEILSILKKVQFADDYLKKNKLDFNELSQKKPHESFLFVDNYRISQSSELYPALKSLFDSVADKEWKQVSGVRLSENLKELVTVKNSREVGKEAFNMQFHCQSDIAPTMCFFKDQGVLYVDKK